MKDATLGGYLRQHERPPAFEGRDGESYTVELMTDPPESGEGAWRAYLFFLRWRGKEPVGHLESDYVSEGDSEEAAREAAEQMSLHDIKVTLDGLIAG
jgi:hypothetical protein